MTIFRITSISKQCIQEHNHALLFIIFPRISNAHAVDCIRTYVIDIQLPITIACGIWYTYYVI